MDNRKKTIMRWLLFPTIYLIVVVWTVHYTTTTGTSLFPNIAPFAGLSTRQKMDKNPLTNTIYIKGVKQAFRAGIIYMHLIQQCCQKTTNVTRCDKLWYELASELDSSNKNYQLYVCNVKKNKLQFYDSSQTSIQRAAGFLNLANCLFVGASVIMISASFPVIRLIVIPLVQTFGPIIVKLFEVLMPFYEPLVYVFSFSMITQSMFYHSTVGSYVAFLGGLFGISGLIYSSALHAPRTGQHEEYFVCLVGGYAQYCLVLLRLRLDQHF